MILKDELGLLPRGLYIVIGLVLAAAAITSDYADWPLIAAHKLPPFGFILINLIALPLALALVLWGCIGRHREWRLSDEGIHIRLLSLTSWRKTRYIVAEDIRTLTQESYGDERPGRAIIHGWIVVLEDGQRLVSPQSLDGAALEVIRLQIESRMRRRKPDFDPLAEASQANGLSG
ncbi:MAG: hypothetical protein QM647_17060 [Asticcacaulis sp.]|uniref:hypothetical protein n=1 Tax=Asticcacaulis sp. TaxID=1872648 RepID=UPI0039E3132B